MNRSLWMVALAAVSLDGCLQSTGTDSPGAAAGASTSPPPGADAGMNGEGGPAALPIVGALDASVITKLPPLPSLTNVVAAERDDSVGIDFDPVAGAADYRVYELPSDDDVTISSGGAVTVANAVYRCAGMRQTFDLQNNMNASDSSLLFENPYTFKADVPDDPTLGYVYAVPAADRLPVFAVAGYKEEDDKGWRESRFKIYTTDPAVRQSYLDQGWRDDGIAFYVPKAPGAGTQTVYSSQQAINQGNGNTNYNQFYFRGADAASHGGDATPPAPAFQVLTAQATDAQPLMVVSYLESNGHMELAVGTERFKRAAGQGVGPLWHLEWSGIARPTTLVVEALQSGCPYQGLLSPTHLEAPPHQPFLTLSDLKSASATGEVFVNGQYDEQSFPVAIARSFVSVTPQPHKAADWDTYSSFADGSDFADVAPSSTPPSCTVDCGHWTSHAWDFSSYLIDGTTQNPVFAYGTLLGAFWVVYDDAGGDVTGKVRFTSAQKASVDADSTKYMHATMSVDIVSTDRRYPQLIVSDQDAPVQEGLANPNNNTLLLQPIQGPAMVLQAQAIHGLVNGGPWDVNNQQPNPHEFVGGKLDHSIAPSDPPFEHAGMDRLTRIDLYLSSQRMYAFMDGQPAGCSLLPADFQLIGPVTVTIGDVLYHEGAGDELVCSQTKPYTFMHEHQCTETKRHFDDVGFKSGVGAPAWDESKLPCLPY